MSWQSRATVLLAALAGLPAAGASAQETTPALPAVEPVPEAQIIDVEALLRGEGRGLTAEDAARRAVESAPSIESARAQLAAARAGADRAMAAFVPRVEFSARYTRLSEITQPNLFSSPGITPAQEAAARALIMAVDDPEARLLFGANLDAQLAQVEQFSSFTFPVILDQYAFGASLTIPVTDVFLQVWPGYEAADSAAHAQRYQIHARASEIAQQAREAYYAYARARGGLAVAQSAVQAVELQEELVAAMVRAGTTAQVDLVRVQAQVAATRVAALRAEAGVRIAEAALRTLLHLESEEPISVAEDLLGPLPTLTDSRAELIDRGLERRPETLALRRLVHARSRQIDAAEGSRWPHLVLAGNLTTASPNQRIFPQTTDFNTTWDISAVAQWSPNDFFAGGFQADEARALRSQAESDLLALEDGIRIQVTQAYEQYRAAVAAIEAATAGVTAADESLRVRVEQYRAGATVVTELVLAVNERARAQLDLINAALDARVAWSQLQRATAQDGPYPGID